MTLIESVKNFIAQCPYLEDMANFGVNNLNEKSNSISLEEVPTTAIVTEYIDGSSDRQFVFTIAARLLYTDEIRQQISNSGIFENIQNWLEKCTNDGELPTMPDGCTAEKIEAMSNGYMLGINGDLTQARYQIQCRLLYFKEA